MTNLNQWADGPWKLLETPGKTQDTKSHAAIHCANEMAHLHNCIIRGINCIYLQAPNVHAADDVKDFLFFTRAWCSFVHHHHQIEEDLVFPRLEAYTGKAGCMSANIEQHHLFEPGLKQLTEYATKTPVGDFDSVKLRALIDGFATALQTHLEAEISTLLDLQSYESKGLMEIFKESEAAGFNQPNNEALPLILGLSDSTYEGGKYVFPAVPGFARYLVHYWYARAHKGAWRFLPCDIWGMPHPLKFLNEPNN